LQTSLIINEGKPLQIAFKSVSNHQGPFGVSTESNKPAPKKNVFYFLLVATGILFATTACAYGVMTVTFIRAAEMADNFSPEPVTQPPLIQFLDTNGVNLMIYELGVLCFFCVAAVALDEVRDRRADSHEASVEVQPDEQPDVQPDVEQETSS
jgi:hypothetical protein